MPFPSLSFPVLPITAPRLPSIPAASPANVKIVSFEKGWGDLSRTGGAGAALREPRSRNLAQDNKESFASVDSYGGMLNALRKLKQENGGRPLQRIAFVTHGSANTIVFGRGDSGSASDLVSRLRQLNLIAKGGTIDFQGCSIASTQKARDDLSQAAVEEGVKIEANDGDSAEGFPNHQWAFESNGQVTKFFGF